MAAASPAVFCDRSYGGSVLAGSPARTLRSRQFPARIANSARGREEARDRCFALQRQCALMRGVLGLACRVTHPPLKPSTVLLNYFVGTGQDRRRHREAKRLRSSEIDR